MPFEAAKEIINIFSLPLACLSFAAAVLRNLPLSSILLHGHQLFIRYIEVLRKRVQLQRCAGGILEVLNYKKLQVAIPVAYLPSSGKA